jgi:hypothetical protein
MPFLDFSVPLTLSKPRLLLIEKLLSLTNSLTVLQIDTSSVWHKKVSSTKKCQTTKRVYSQGVPQLINNSHDSRKIKVDLKGTSQRTGRRKKRKIRMLSFRYLVMALALVFTQKFSPEWKTSYSKVCRSNVFLTKNSRDELDQISLRKSAIALRQSTFLWGGQPLEPD